MEQHTLKDIRTLLPHAHETMSDLVDALIVYAYEKRASDIHIDPHEEHAVVRVRIDGVLEPLCSIAHTSYGELIARIKICARLRTDEHNAPHDGRYTLTHTETPRIDIRVSITPTYYGENAVLRLLVAQHRDTTLHSLGISKVDSQKIERALKKKSGMMLLTGPTGSGKTTTLYSLLTMCASPEICAITIEDPIEYSLPHVRQIQVNNETRLTFGSGLRSILRQDPDIIMVGEIRDHETASLAVNASLTGHLLLSTLHTNSASSALPRLTDLKVEPFLIASTIEIIIAQRLVRTLCTTCKKKEKPPQHVQERITNVVRDVSWENYHQPRGCADCNQSGYKGRTGIYEVLMIDENIRALITERQPAHTIEKYALESGMTSLKSDGVLKALRGETTIEEIARVLSL